MGDEVCGQGSAVRRGKKSIPWRRDPIIQARLLTVDRMRLANKTQAEIAAATNVSEATVRDDLKRLNELWRERVAAAQDDNRARALAELEDVRVRALEAAEWDLACERAVLFGEKIEQRTCPGGVEHPIDGSNKTLKCEGAHEVGLAVYRDAKGSAQFRGNKAASLAQARQAVMDKAKLLGLVVDKAALTDTKGEDLPIDDLMARFARRQEKDAAPTEGGG